MNIYDLLQSEKNINPKFLEGIKKTTISEKKPSNIFFTVNKKHVGIDDFNAEMYDFLKDILDIEGYVFQAFIEKAKRDMQTSKAKYHLSSRLTQEVENRKTTFTSENGEEYHYVSVDSIYEIFKELFS